MNPNESQDPTIPKAHVDPTVEQVAGELTAELVRTDEVEASLPPALARRLVELGESAVARRALGSRPVRRADWTARGGWLLAAAAVAAWVLVPSPFASRGSDAPAAAAPSPVEAVLANATALHVPWVASTDPAATAATGEVIWDAGTQRGVLRITGLVPNDPRLAQYQLWIIDAERDARYPVDGGVFDVTSQGEVLVPVTARLRVGRPTLFAITLEKPGGVVVSGRERLVLAAPVTG
jgi:anti-sigma-K factor RskA